jgi:alkylhydroperoxidase/carboxymuconolactone decarboxylase family protein YurZ
MAIAVVSGTHGAYAEHLVHCWCEYAAGNTEQLTFHLGLARRNGVTQTELTEAITHLAFYAGWPKAMSAMTVAKQALGGDQDQ